MAYEATVSWLLGFASAYNIYHPDDDKVIPPNVDNRGMAAWVIITAAKNPLDEIYTAAVKLMRELSERKR